MFTSRMGYRKENAIRMLTMGCYNTLWTLRKRLEEQPLANLDNQDRISLELARKWMGIETWPSAQDEQEELRDHWQCHRTACIFHTQHCSHGAMYKELSR
jgi:hypothetical protein